MSSLRSWSLAAGLFPAVLLLCASSPAAPVADVSRTEFQPVTDTADTRDADQLVRHQPLPIDLKLGERLVYEIRWVGLPAGQAVLQVKYQRDLNGASIHHVECRTRSNAFLDMIYPVDDQIISIIDAERGFSHLYEMVIREGSIDRQEHIRFDYEQGIAVYERQETGPFSPRTRKSVRIEDYLQDPLSCLYYLRQIDLAPGSVARMPVHTARRAWTLSVEALRREQLDIPGYGELTALRIEPAMMFPGIFVRKGRMVIWLEEKSRVPVLMHVDIPIGTVTVTLTDSSNAPLLPAGAAAEDGE